MHHKHTDTQIQHDRARNDECSAFLAENICFALKKLCTQTGKTHFALEKLRTRTGKTHFALKKLRTQTGKIPRDAAPVIFYLQEKASRDKISYLYARRSRERC